MTSERQSGLAIVGSYTYPYEADVARALLESHEISAWVLDEHQVRTRWHLSQALGGVKVAVHPDDDGRAREILDADHSQALQEIAEFDLPADPDEICQACGSSRVVSSRGVSRISARTVLGGLLSYVFGLILPLRNIREKWKCLECDTEWTKDRRS